MKLQTPYYLIDERKLLCNLEKIKYLRDFSGVRSVLALKCFSSWAVFDLMKQYMDGTTSSSVFEARLGYEKFGKETHAYSVGWSDNDIKEVRRYADKIIFNSVSQLQRYIKLCNGLKIGLRINPGFSYSHFDLADPARRYSRLGTRDKNDIFQVVNLLSGVMFHFNCENDNFESFVGFLKLLESNWGELFTKIEWVSLGGGLYFTKKNYPLKKFCHVLKKFSERFNIQLYLEPGEAAITCSAELVTTVVDIVHNEMDIAIVDASTEAHMLDLLIYQTPAKIEKIRKGRYRYIIAGNSCLAGDVFGTYSFSSRLKVGDQIRFSDAAGYSIVKKNWFNGLRMPSIVVRRLDGSIELVRRFNYKDFLHNLS